MSAKTLSALTRSDTGEIMQTDRNHLAQTLDSLRGKAAHPDVKDISEAATRAIFIDPLLKAIGFEGLGDIEWEYFVKVSKEHIDYVLKVADRPTVAVEAKSFKTELVDSHAAQLVQYAAVEGIEWCLLTNGREMRVYNASLRGDLGAKHVADLDLLAEQQQALDVLTLLSKEGLRHQDRLRAWMREALFDRTLRSVLLNPDSLPVQQLASAVASATGFDLTPEQVSRWFARVFAPEPPKPEPSPRPPDPLEKAVSYWLLPAGPADDGTPPEEQLHRWLGRRMWGMGRSTPGRKRMRQGDFLCFYATGIGVVVRTRLAGPPDELVTAEEWPETTTMEGEVFKVPLGDIEWLAEPIAVDERLRSELDAFQGKKTSPKWSWFVQTTRKLSERDYKLLAGRV